MARLCGACAVRVREREKCADCGKPRCARHLVSYVDGNNGAITKNAKEYCLACYRKNHPEVTY